MAYSTNRQAERKADQGSVRIPSGTGAKDSRVFMKEFEMPTSEKQPTFGRRAIDIAGHIVSVMLRLVLKLALILVVVAFGLFVGSFLQFTSKVANTVEPDEV